MASSLDVEGRLQRRWPFGARLLEAVQRVDLGFVANSVAFQAFSALLPLIVVLFVVVAVVAGETFANQVLALTEGVVPDETRRLLIDEVTSQLRSTSTSVVSVAVLLWGALNLFKGLDTAFSMVYLTGAENSLVEQTRDALVIFGVLLLAVAAAVVSGSVPFLTRIPLLDVLSPLILLVALVGVFLPMYVVFPDTDVSVREALPGAVIAAVGLAALQALFGLYVAYAASDATNGAIGAVLLLLTWLYFGSFLLLFGAVVNATVAGVGADEPSSDDPVPSPD